MAAKRIAVVNEDTVFLRLMHELLVAEGYDPSLHVAGNTAYAEVRETHPDLVIIDIGVGREGQGWIVVDLLKLDPETNRIPMIVCSTDGLQLHSKAEYLRQQGIDTLEKPFSLEALFQKLSSRLVVHKGAPQEAEGL